MNKFTAYHGDLRLSLRKIGNSQPSIVIDVDEGDGIDFSFKGHKIDKEHYQEWIDQLEIITERLKELKDE